MDWTGYLKDCVYKKIKDSSHYQSKNLLAGNFSIMVHMLRNIPAYSIKLEIDAWIGVKERHI